MLWLTPRLGSLAALPPPQAARAWFDEYTNDQAFEWEEAKTIDLDVYRQMGKDGLLTCLAFGAKTPAKYASEDGTVFGGVKVDEWDGFHDYVRRRVIIQEEHRY